MMMIIALNSRVRKGGKEEYGGIRGEKEENDDYGGMMCKRGCVGIVHETFENGGSVEPASR